MNNRPTGMIRKIILGQNPLNGLAFTVGQRAGRESEGKVVSLILEDLDNYYTFGTVRYFIYCDSEKAKNVLWKSFVSIPVALEYDADDDVSFV